MWRKTAFSTRECLVIHPKFVVHLAIITSFALTQGRIGV